VGYMRAVTSEAYVAATTAFNPSRNFTDLYSATWTTSPLKAPAEMGALRGFNFSVAYDIGRVVADDFGVVSLSLNGITWSGAFAPSNATEVEIDAMLNLQGTTVNHPGSSVSSPSTKLADLVVTGPHFVFTLHDAAPTVYTGSFGANESQHGDLVWGQETGWTAGAADPLVTMTIPT
jgi:hypothetical protein